MECYYYNYHYHCYYCVMFSITGTTTSTNANANAFVCASTNAFITVKNNTNSNNVSPYTFGISLCSMCFFFPFFPQSKHIQTGVRVSETELTKSVLVCVYVFGLLSLTRCTRPLPIFSWDWPQLSWWPILLITTKTIRNGRHFSYLIFSSLNLFNYRIIAS